MFHISPRARKRVLRTGSAAFLLIVLFWLGYVPERRDRVFRAMPENSPFVSEHLNLSRVWRARFDNPLLVRTLQGAGVRKVEEWSADTNIVWIVRLVSGRRSLIGWSPSLGPSGQPCWTGASWAGFRGPLLRAMLFVRWVPGLGRLATTPRGTRFLETVSKRKRARGETGPKIGFILRENILLATLGDDPDAVHDLDRRLVADAPLAPLFKDDPEPWRQTGSIPHRAWVAPGLSPLPLPFTRTAEARLTHFEHNRIGVELALPGVADNAAAEPRAGLTSSCVAADALGADAACALLMLPAAAAQDGLIRLLPALDPAWRVPASGKSAALYITTQTLGGRLFGLAVPAVTLLYPDPPGTPDAIVQAVEAVSGALSLKLRTRASGDGGGTGRLLVDWMGRSKYFRLASEDCVAIESHPGWLTLCSAAASLDAQRQFSAETSGAWRAPLASQLATAGESGLDGFLWIDLARTTDELRQIHAVYRLASSLGAVRVTKQESVYMEQARTILQALEIEGALALAWRQDGTHLRLNLRLSAP
jgi:hypothetical protein